MELWSWRRAGKAIMLLLGFFLWPLAIVFICGLALLVPKKVLLDWEEGMGLLWLSLCDLMLYVLFIGLILQDRHWALIVGSGTLALYLNSYIFAELIVDEEESAA